MHPLLRSHRSRSCSSRAHWSLGAILFALLGLLAAACGTSTEPVVEAAVDSSVEETPTEGAAVEVVVAEPTVEAEPVPTEEVFNDPDMTSPTSSVPAATTVAAAPAAVASGDCGGLNPPINTIASDSPAQTLRDAELSFIERHDVGLSEIYELSGLALADDGQSLWTVSDTGFKIFKIRLDGSVICELPAPSDDLEGIAIHPSGEYLYVVHEKLAEILMLDITTGEVIKSVRLPDMAGYAEAAFEVEHGGDNKSLEGIAPANGKIYLLKEGDPGLIMAVSEDLTTFLGYRLLHGPNGFIDDQVPSDKIDYAGLVYDPTRDAFWIVSDRGRRLYLYRWEENAVFADPELRFAPELGSGTVEKAEGLAFDIAARRFYMMSEVENRLYVFDLLG